MLRCFYMYKLEESREEEGRKKARQEPSERHSKRWAKERFEQRRRRVGYG
jgi:hypothetical protein